MIDQLEGLLDVATEIRELLKLLAEPAIALRDEKPRGFIKQIAGKSLAKQKAISLMDGSRNQKVIALEAKIDHGDLSKLVKSLRTSGLLFENDKPRLRIPLPINFFGE